MWYQWWSFCRSKISATPKLSDYFLTLYLSYITLQPSEVLFFIYPSFFRKLGSAILQNPWSSMSHSLPQQWQLGGATRIGFLVPHLGVTAPSSYSPSPVCCHTGLSILLSGALTSSLCNFFVVVKESTLLAWKIRVFTSRIILTIIILTHSALRYCPDEFIMQ